MTKKITAIFLLTGFIAITTANAQTADSIKSTNGDGKNMVKVNLTSLALKNFSFQYERAIGGKKAFVVGIRYMPKSGIPLKSTIKDLIDDAETSKQIDDFKTGNFAITPEIRFYMGKGVFRGFYVAPFARYSHYTAELPINFDVNGTTETIPMSGDLTTLTAGLQLGVQWKLSKMVYLDLMMLGPQYGSSAGSITGKKTLNAQEQSELRSELEGLDLPLVKTTTTVDANGATLDFKGPWAGVRAGINLGFRF